MIQEKLSTILTVLAVIISLIAASHILIGQLICVELAMISIVALIGWLKFNIMSNSIPDKIVAPYLLSVFLVLSLDSVRFLQHYPAAFLAGWSKYFNSHSLFTTDNWFLIYVTALVSVFLFGGYLLIKNYAGGYYIAWWMFVFCIVEPILQISVEWRLFDVVEHYCCAAILIAFVAAVTGIIGCMRLANSSGMASGGCR